MKNEEGEDLTRVHVLLFTSDYEQMKIYFKDLGLTKAIRTIVHNYMKNLNAKLEAKHVDISKPASRG